MNRIVNYSVFTEVVKKQNRISPPQSEIRIHPLNITTVMGFKEDVKEDALLNYSVLILGTEESYLWWLVSEEWLQGQSTKKHFGRIYFLFIEPSDNYSFIVDGAQGTNFSLNIVEGFILEV